MTNCDVQENFEAVVEDCDRALKIKPLFTKALERRHRANVALERLEDALVGGSPIYLSRLWF